MGKLMSLILYWCCRSTSYTSSSSSFSTPTNSVYVFSFPRFHTRRIEVRNYISNALLIESFPTRQKGANKVMNELLRHYFIVRL
jgi:hypothetical protein